MTDLIEVQTSTLDGAALDWAVAQVEGIEVAIAAPHYGTDWRVYRPEPGGKYSPTTDWAVGGLLIETRIECLESFAGRSTWDACCWGAELPSPSLYREQGETALVAACRTIVAAKLGDTVQVPKELIQ